MMVNYSQKEITPERAEKIAKYLHEKNITQANFKSLVNFKSSFKYLAPVLGDNTTLTEVNLDDNEFEDDEADLLIDIFKTNTTITHLTVDLRKLSKNKRKEFSEKLQKCFTLEYIEVGYSKG